MYQIHDISHNFDQILLIFFILPTQIMISLMLLILISLMMANTNTNPNILNLTKRYKLISLNTESGHIVMMG